MVAMPAIARERSVSDYRRLALPDPKEPVEFLESCRSKFNLNIRLWQSGGGQLAGEISLRSLKEVWQRRVVNFDDMLLALLQALKFGSTWIVSGKYYL